MSTTVEDPKKEALGRAIAKWIHVYAWLVHGLFIPLLYFGGILVSAFDNMESRLSWLVPILSCLALAGLPIVLVGRFVANQLTLRDDARSYDAVKVYFVGIAFYFVLSVVVAVLSKIVIS
ncbi:hypothetical protein [Rubritalea sp.]|uniref:hypothetical protein n=1 Tax=Rubritalea sp. TaxID=2109375 RepID=UPI003242A6F6